MARNLGWHSTTENVLTGVDLAGKRMLVTGVSAGLGVETARALAACGAEVIGTARDLEKGRAAFQAMKEQLTGPGSLRLVEMDLASLASVRRCADALVEQGGVIDLIIANAATMACPEATTADGFELQFGTNHLGHFVFVNRLAPLLREGSRVVILASAGHRRSDVDLDDPNFARSPYEALVAYSRSKTATILFAVEFDRRYKRRGIRAAAVHPGTIETELSRHMDPEEMRRTIAAIDQMQARDEPAFQWKTVAQGAATSVWAGVVAAPDLIGGRYCEDCSVSEIIDTENTRRGVRSYAVDPERAKMLWSMSQTMVGEQLDAKETAVERRR